MCLVGPAGLGIPVVPVGPGSREDSPAAHRAARGVVPPPRSRSGALSAFLRQFRGPFCGVAPAEGGEGAGSRPGGGPITCPGAAAGPGPGVRLAAVPSVTREFWSRSLCESRSRCWCGSRCPARSLRRGSRVLILMRAPVPVPRSQPQAWFGGPDPGAGSGVGAGAPFAAQAWPGGAGGGAGRGAGAGAPLAAQAWPGADAALLPPPGAARPGPAPHSALPGHRRHCRGRRGWGPRSR